jgi:hypothetical protein
MFDKEKRNEEYEKIKNIRRKNLPLHIHDKFLFTQSKEFFDRRLKGDEK